MQNHLRRGSIALLCLLAIGFAVNGIGIPVSITMKPDDIGIELPPHVYMLNDTPKRLRVLPKMFDLIRDPPFAKTGNANIRLLENGRPLNGGAFVSFQDVVDTGGGRYYYRPDRLSFSASDNSDPRTNGRTYTVEYRVGLRRRIIGLLAILLIAARAALVLNGRSAAAVVGPQKV